MTKKQKIILIAFLSSTLLTHAQKNTPPKFRGIWISTVKMLDYPSKKNLNSQQLKKEFITILDSCKKIGINTIIFQIRPAADAFYNSKYEPWSEWLTGKQGRKPQPYFDPLDFMITQTHKRNMQFHAWINPFRAIATIEKANITKNHITHKKPEWFFNYGVNKYFDPGIPEVQNYLIKIIADIVNRYNIDAIHFDDYFYPYPIRNNNNKIIEIPDKKTFLKYKKNFTNIKNWRRNNINNFVKQTHNTIKKIKPNVRFGISPPAIWRNKGYDPKGSETLGLAAYDWIYADILLWLKNNWIDYVAPQLYWYIGHKRANFETLVKWWDKNNYNTDLYIGLNIHAIDKSRKNKHWGNPNQIPKQIKIANSYKSVKGFILYRYKSLEKNPLGIKDSLRENYFNDKTSTQNTTDSTQNTTDSTQNTTDSTQNIIASAQNIIASAQNIIASAQNTTPPHQPINLDLIKYQKEITLLWDSPTDIDSIKYFIIYIKPYKTTETPQQKKIFMTTINNYARFMKKTNIISRGEKYTLTVTAIGKNNKESKPSNPLTIRLKHNQCTHTNTQDPQ